MTNSSSKYTKEYFDNFEEILRKESSIKHLGFGKEPHSGEKYAMFLMSNVSSCELSFSSIKRTIMQMMILNSRFGTYRYNGEEKCRESVCGVDRSRSAGDLYKMYIYTYETRSTWKWEMEYSFYEFYLALMELCDLGMLSSLVCGDINKRVYSLAAGWGDSPRTPETIDEFGIRQSEFGLVNSKRIVDTDDNGIERISGYESFNIKLSYLDEKGRSKCTELMIEGITGIVVDNIDGRCVTHKLLQEIKNSVLLKGLLLEHLWADVLHFMRMAKRSAYKDVSDENLCKYTEGIRESIRDVISESARKAYIDMFERKANDNE